MSYDCKLTNGDIGFSSDGAFELVSDTDKLKQDVSKILLTPRGFNSDSPQYGSKIGDIQGKSLALGRDVIQSLVTKSVAESLQFLQSAEILQSTKQELTYAEVIAKIDAVAVTIENKQVTINLALLTVGGERIIFGVQ